MVLVLLVQVTLVPYVVDWNTVGKQVLHFKIIVVRSRILIQKLIRVVVLLATISEWSVDLKRHDECLDAIQRR